MHEVADEHLLAGLLADNDALAEHNREHFDQLGALALNVMSAPGAGKTTLIERTASMLKDRWPVCVIEGDMVGELDAARLIKAGIPSFQITTGRSCHLDARMVSRLLHDKQLPNASLVFIENVGNLVCPADFYLGEHLRVVLLSVTEGDDKPYKYPVIFRRCDAVVFTKADLLPLVDFSIVRAQEFVKAINPDASIFVLSSTDGTGLSKWVQWITCRLTRRAQPIAVA